MDEAVEACERAPLNPLSLRPSGGEDQEPRHELWDTGHVPTTYHLRALLTGCPQGPGGVEGSCGGSLLLAHPRLAPWMEGPFGYGQATTRATGAGTLREPWGTGCQAAAIGSQPGHRVGLSL